MSYSPTVNTTERASNQSHMALRLQLRGWGLLLVAAFLGLQSQAESVLRLQPVTDPPGYLLTWDLDESQTSPATSLRLQRSTDLETWEDLFAIDLRRSVNDEIAHEYLDTEAGAIAFYRLIQGSATLATVRSAASGAEIYGFNDEYKRVLAELGEISVAEFLSRYQPTEPLLDKVSYDPTSAEFWDLLNQPVEQPDPDLPPHIPQDVHLTDFSLNEEELALFKKNGFVVSGRKGDHSYTDSYYKIFTDDLPVFVSLDSVLHAWHYNYKAILAELEELILAGEFKEILSAMRAQLPLIAENASPVVANSLNDADIYLNVALSLFNETASPSILGLADPEITQLVALIEQEGLGSISIFGRTNPETIDFSQFKPRGHYTRSKLLRRYFKAAMWCGRTDFRVAGPANIASERELATAIILQEAMTRANKVDAWNQFDDVIEVMVGLNDSMTVNQLTSVLTAGGIQSVADITSLAQLSQIQQQIETGNLGVQGILSHGFFTSGGGPALTLPRSFTLFGQRFVMDSWAMSQMVFDRVIRGGKKLARRLPSGVDVAFTVFDNQSAADILADRIQTSSGVPFRDGYPIQHNLGALNDVFSTMPADRWQENVYNSWLFTLREMSQPYPESVPEVFRTRAWARKNLSSQLASWAQLRHNTVLYAKQSSSPPVLCSFPHSYVEPNEGAWAALAQMANLMADKFENLNLGRPTVGPFGFPIFPRDILGRHVTVLRNFEQTCGKLKDIVQKQNAREPLSTTQTWFVRNMVEIMTDYVGIRSYSGWYPRLYYASSDIPASEHPSDDWDPVVTDVHTNLPSPLQGDPGTILHEAVGNTAMMIVSVNCLQHRVYAGPVATHYEFTSGPGNFDRMTDEEWKQRLLSDNPPVEPEWTRGHRISGKVNVPNSAR